MRGIVDYVHRWQHCTLGAGAARAVRARARFLMFRQYSVVEGWERPATADANTLCVL